MTRINIFSLLALVAFFSIVIRLGALVIDGHGQSGSTLSYIATAEAVEHKKKEGEDAEKEEDEPPPISLPHNTKIRSHNDPNLDAIPNLDPYPTVFSNSELNVLHSLSKRRKELDRRTKSLIKKEALLKVAEKEVDKKIKELSFLKAELETLLGKQTKAQNKRIYSLVKIYENMKPKDAARIFDTLDLDVLLKVIGKISERKVSPILASMNPERAREVTIELAAQHSLPKLP